MICLLGDAVQYCLTPLLTDILEYLRPYGLMDLVGNGCNLVIADGDDGRAVIGQFLLVGRLIVLGRSPSALLELGGN